MGFGWAYGFDCYFDIMMETDDIIDFNSFDKGIEILEKYHINMD